MNYSDWFETHGQKHQKIVAKLQQQGLSIDAIIDYFDFESMCQNEPDFCALYATHKKCHDIASLNCYLCACPNFRFDDNAKEVKGIKHFSYCDINSADGAIFKDGNNHHQDCSKCAVPHHKSYVKKHFKYEWFEIMGACDKSPS